MAESKVVPEELAVEMARDFVTKRFGRQLPPHSVKFIRGAWLVDFESGLPDELSSMYLVNVDPLSGECRLIHT